jgi:cob(I)alamin adenosyltransferase
MSVTQGSDNPNETSLVFGRRVAKTHIRVRTTGSVDALNASLGLCRVHAQNEATARQVLDLQQSLVAIMSELSTDDADQDRLRERKGEQLLQPADLQALQDQVAAKEAACPPMRGWIYPGESAAQAYFEQARVACRAAERAAIALLEAGHPVRQLVIDFLNRLSSLIWLLGREHNPD